MWTDQVAQAEIQKWLATNPGELNGIVIQSASELGALRRLEAEWTRHGPDHDRRRARCVVLLAQKSKVHLGSYPCVAARRRLRDELEHHDADAPRPGTKGPIHPHQAANDDVRRPDQGAERGLQRRSDGWYNVGAENWASKAYLDQFFLRPADPEAFKP